MSTKTYSIEKLRGRENYDTWKRAAQAYLTINGYWSCIKTEVSDATSEAIKDKHEKALSELYLMVETQIYPYLEGCESIKAAWNALSKAFDDNGTCRKVHILQQFTSTKFADCASMENYVNTMTSLWAKVKSVGFQIDEEVAASLLLAGLPAQYQPLIFGLENSKEKLTMDYVKNILLQGALTPEAATSSALFTKEKKSFKNKKHDKVKCFNCGGPHYAKKCHKKKKDYNASNYKNNESANLCTDEMVLFSAFTANDSDVWYFDSGATAHMCNNDNNLQNKRKPMKNNIKAANNEIMNVQCTGDIFQSVKTVNGTNDLLIKNVQYLPDLCVNLLSVSQIVQNNNIVVFKQSGCTVYNHKKRVIATGSLENGLFKLNTTSDIALSATSDENVKLWHRRMGHMSISNMHFLKDTSNMKLNCVICAEAKHCRTPFPKNGTRASELLGIIHSDVCGPMSTASLGGNKFYVTFIDDYSRMTRVFLMRNKSQVYDYFIKYKSFVENQLGKKIKILRTDNGTEYVNHKFQQVCEKSGILHQKSCPHTPQQNGLAERYNRTIVERARCMLFDANLSRGFWGEAVLTAVKIMNSTWNSGINGIPEEIWSGKSVDLSKFRIFGCKAMVKVPDGTRKKWDKKSIECIFVGYAEEQKGYRFLEKSTRKLIISRDVMFFENEMSTRDKQCNTPFMMVEKKSTDDELREESEADNSSSDLYDSSIETSVRDRSNESNETLPQNSTVISMNDGNESSGTMTNDVSAINNDVDNLSEMDDTAASTLDDRRADPSYHGRATISGGDRPATRSISRFLNPFSGFAFFSVSEALESPERDGWKAAMDDEMKSLMENRTWDLVPLPSGKKALRNKWVLRKKMDSNGTEKYKARLVVKGCSQRKGIDYDEVYSPVVRYASIRYLMSLAAQFDMEIFQMDAVTAFLQGDLDDEIYMYQPEYFNDHTDKVCKLRKSIYGLKQASRIWNSILSKVLMKAGYTQSKMDSCVYFKFVIDKKIFIAIYVDDVLIFTNCANLKHELREILMSNFKMKDLGIAKFCVGLHITRDRKNGIIYLDQSKYIEELLEKFGMSNCNPIDTPGDSNSRLTKEERTGDFDPSVVPYQQAVGCLLYLTQGTRPDIAYVVNEVSRYNNCFTNTHWQAVKRIFRYLKGTTSLRLSFKRSANGFLFGHCDADWASDVNERRSCTGYVFLRSSGAVSWNSRRQPTVALSTAEAEYMALSSATQEAMWLKNLEDEIFHGDRPVNIFSDNQSAISLANNNGYSARCKHIDIRHHFVRQKVYEKKCILHYVNTNDNAADALTKNLNKQKFQSCRKLFGMI